MLYFTHWGFLAIDYKSGYINNQTVEQQLLWTKFTQEVNSNYVLCWIPTPPPPLKTNFVNITMLVNYMKMSFTSLLAVYYCTVWLMAHTK